MVMKLAGSGKKGQKTTFSLSSKGPDPKIPHLWGRPRPRREGRSKSRKQVRERRRRRKKVRGK